MDKTVVKAFGVLELLVRADGPMSVTQLANATGLQNSNAHQVLATLGTLRYVRRGDSSLYEPSLRIWERGQQVYSRLSIASAAPPILRRLVGQTGESAHLAIFDRGEIVYIDRIETENPVRAYTAIGGRAPAYCTASGKAFLAYQPIATVQAVAKTIRRQTPATIVDFPALMLDRALVRYRGYAINLGEYRTNVAALALPVQGSNGEVIAAVGIYGPLERLRPRKIKLSFPIVIDAAKAIAQLMGAPRR